MNSGNLPVFPVKLCFELCGWSALMSLKTQQSSLGCGQKPSHELLVQLFGAQCLTGLT